MRLLLLSCSLLLLVSCDRAETKTSAVTTVSPSGGSTAPSSASAESRDEALVRVVHAIPYGAAMDVFAGDLLVFDAIGFKAVTSYRAVDGKRYSFALRPAGMTNAKPLASNTEGLEDGHYYTVFALPGPDRSAHLRIVGDSLTRPASGKARLRVVHGGDGIGDVTVRSSGANGELFARVTFQAVTDYQDVTPINGTIEIRTADAATSVITLPNAHLEGGRFYTLVLAGSTQTGSAPEAFIIEDKLGVPATSH